MLNALILGIKFAKNRTGIPRFNAIFCLDLSILIHNLSIAPDCLHHIVFKGIERCKIFRDNKHRDNFIDRLENVLSGSKTPCCARTQIPSRSPVVENRRHTPYDGQAAYFNRRHRRHGNFFQNRYKSILCRKDVFLLELVRYIPLNPLRTKIVNNMKKLDKYLYCGHSRIVRKHESIWQDVFYKPFQNLPVSDF